MKELQKDEVLVFDYDKLDSSVIAFIMQTERDYSKAAISELLL